MYDISKMLKIAGVSSQFDLDLDPLHFDIGSPPFRYRCPPLRRTIYLGNMYF